MRRAIVLAAVLAVGCSQGRSEQRFYEDCLLALAQGVGERAAAASSSRLGRSWTYRMADLCHLLSRAQDYEALREQRLRESDEFFDSLPKKER